VRARAGRISHLIRASSSSTPAPTHTTHRRPKAVFKDAKHVLNLKRLESAEGSRQQRHPQGSPAAIEPQIAHTYARANVDDAKAQAVAKLRLRIEEMIVCKESYLQEGLGYVMVALAAMGSIQDREENFINRQGLSGQFEDGDRRESGELSFVRLG